MDRTRRNFLQFSAAATGAAWVAGLTDRSARGQDAKPSAATAPAAAATTQAGEPPLRFGVVGTGGIARSLGKFIVKHGVITAVCDVDRLRMEKYNADFAKGAAFATGDHRVLVDRTDVDAVYIGTPDHWHAKVAADAMRAGKDVYCEKPLTLTIDEGRFLCRVTRETGRVLQVGTQQRNDERFQTAVALAHSGRLGKIRKVMVAVGDTKAKGEPDFRAATPPPELDWDRWLGQAPLVDYVPSRCHYNFRWWYEYSGGRMTDWGAHHVDIAQWAAAPDLPGPTTVEPVMVEHPVTFEHGWPAVDDAYNTATRFHVRCTFANGVVMDILNSRPDLPAENGILVEGDEGSFFINRQKFEGAPVDALARDPLPEGAVPTLLTEIESKHERHVADFIACCRSRATPKSDVWSHHRNLTTCHLANIALRLGRTIRWDASAQEIVGDAEANAFQTRPQREGYEVV